MKADTTASTVKQDFASAHADAGRPRYFPLKYAIMAAFLLLVMPILVAMSLFNYFSVKEDLQNAYSLLQQQSENSIVKSIQLIDSGLKILENLLNEDMKRTFVQFNAAYEEAGRNPAKMDLAALKLKLGGKMDLYIIDMDGVVKYTTYQKDLNLNFKIKFPDFYQDVLRYIKQNEFIPGFITTEAQTGILRQFSYMPSADHKYLFELGLISDDFKDMMGDLDLLKVTDMLRTLNPSLDSVRIYTRNGHLLGDSNFKVDPEAQKIVAQAYQEKKGHQFADEVQRRQTHYLYTAADAGGGKADRGRVVELVYNTRLIDESLQKKSEIYIIISVLAIALSILSTFLLAAWITGPIKQIVESVDIIAKGDLSYPIDNVSAKNELKLLKQSIIIMVSNMRDYINRIEKQNVDLKALDKLKDDFLSNTSHELRTPINGIIGIADSMVAGAAGDLPPKAIENLSMLVISGRRLSNLVNDILDFSKLKHNSIELQLRPIEMRVVADVVLTLSRPLLGKKKIEILNNIPAEPAVNADENRLQQIFYNLIGNAVKFTEAGKIELSGEVQGGFVLVKVCDSGIGIPADKVGVIFNSFEQGDGSTARQYGGTGLGLSITKQLVELHGGKISVESTVGVGTCVTFTLPVSSSKAEASTSDQLASLNITRDMAALESADAGAVSNAASQKIAMENSQGKEVMNVLIVDDEPINLQVLENVLRLDNYNVIRANNGFEALEAVKSGMPFAMVLLDLMMPRMSGFEVCRVIRETYPASKLPIIMLTAKNQVSDLVEGLQAGANDYITKPFNKNELTTRIRTHVQLARITIAYSYFVPHQFLRLLEKESITDVSLGDHVQKHMTVLFVDIRSFTTLSEKMTPKENFDFINEYLGRMSPVIRTHNGFIDKYIGDAIMALFPGKAEDGVQAAIDIHRQLVKFNEEREQKGLLPVKIGVGVHIGNLMLGTIGEEQRMEGTVISDAVNLASRLEGLTKAYGASPVISEQILAEIPDLKQYHYRFLDKVKVKGKKEPVKIYEVMDIEDVDVREKARHNPRFEQALEAYYARRFDQAAALLRKILAETDDKAAQIYLERCEYYRDKALPADWDGVEALTEK
jgi:two-component system sensor histidine kinase ChiS